MDIIKENAARKQDIAENYMNKEILDKFKEKSMQTTLYLATTGRKKLWKPDKLQSSRKVKVADNMNELLDRK